MSSLPTLIYALDPLCGWCFAFTHGIDAVLDEFEGEVGWEVSCGGLVVQRDFGGRSAIEFATELCRSFYADGRLPDEPGTIASVAETLGLDADAVTRSWTSHEAKTLTRLEFEDARRRGMDRYPSLYVRHEGVILPVVSGYSNPEAAVARIHDALRRLSESELNSE